jgi:putative membrane protein insertion efficiency factor
VTLLSMPFFSAVAAVLLMTVYPISGQEFTFDCMKDMAILKAAPVAEDTASNQQGPLLPEDEVSDVRIVSRFLIRVYQAYVSSQQHNVCVFTPSCSHFGMEAVERFGFVKGFLPTADRLTRCNSFVSQGGYEFDPVSGKFIDNVADYSSSNADTASSATSCGMQVP